MQGACHWTPAFATPQTVRACRTGPLVALSGTLTSLFSAGHAPADTNKFVMTVDPVTDKAPFLSVVEIFEAGGKTPLHKHEHAHEMFYVLSGRGRAHCDGATYDMEKGDTLVLPPGMDHVVENVGSDRLYCLTVMVPNEGLAELIRAGAVMTLDAADEAVVGATPS